jgi:hypothetical protein
VERRESRERAQELDCEEKDDDETVEYQAYRRVITRGLIAFEWDVVLNTAMLQVSQLPASWKYEHARDRFTKLLSKWLDLTTFDTVDLGKCVPYCEQQGGIEVRSHGIGYLTPQGRRMTASTAVKDQALLGAEAAIDTGLAGVRMAGGMGRAGNFFFLPQAGGPSREIHVVVQADKKQRVGFTTDNIESDVRHVLQRIREACQ